MAFDKEAFLAAAANGVFNPPEPERGLVRQNKGLGGDLATDLKRGVQGIPGMVTGVLDLPVKAVTGESLVGKGWDELGKLTGFQPSKWAEEANQEYSAGRQASKADINRAWDDKNTNGWDVAAAYARNPGASLGTVVESLPSMVAGGVGGNLALKGVLKAAENKGATAAELAALSTKLTPVYAGASEGAVTTGQQMDATQNLEGRGKALAALGAGATTAAIGFGATKAANAMGLQTAEGAIVGVGNKAGVAEGAERGLTKRMLAGGTVEGVLQEFPQSAQEQMWQNYAEDKPLLDGALRAGVEGGIAGFGMGAAFNMANRRNANPTPQDSTEAIAEKLTNLEARYGPTLKQQQDNEAAAAAAHTASMDQGMAQGTLRQGDLFTESGLAPTEIVSQPPQAPAAPTQPETDPTQGALDLSTAKERAIQSQMNSVDGVKTLMEYYSAQPASQEKTEVLKELRSRMAELKDEAKANKAAGIEQARINDLAENSAFNQPAPDLFSFTEHDPLIAQRQAQEQAAVTPEVAPVQQDMFGRQEQHNLPLDTPGQVALQQQDAAAREVQVKTATAQVDAELKQLYTAANQMGIPAEAMPTPFGEFAQDKHISPEQQLEWKAKHVEQLKGLMAQEDARKAGQAGTEQFLKNADALTKSINMDKTMRAPAPLVAPESVPKNLIIDHPTAVNPDGTPKKVNALAAIKSQDGIVAKCYSLVECVG